MFVFCFVFFFTESAPTSIQSSRCNVHYKDLALKHLCVGLQMGALCREYYTSVFTARMEVTAELLSKCFHCQNGFKKGLSSKRHIIVQSIKLQGNGGGTSKSRQKSRGTGIAKLAGAARHWYSHSFFVEISSRNLYSQTKWVRHLKFWENVHLPLCVTCHVSHVMCHMSCFTCHVSHVTCNMSCVTCPIFLSGQRDWASCWRVCYQRGLPV